MAKPTGDGPKTGGEYACTDFRIPYIYTLLLFMKRMEVQQGEETAARLPVAVTTMT